MAHFALLLPKLPKLPLNSEMAETRFSPKREPGFVSRSLPDQKGGQIMPLPSSGS